MVVEITIAVSNTIKTIVVNLHKEPYDNYIGRVGRGKSGYFGNKHPIGYCSTCNVVHDRAKSIEAFRLDFNKRIEKDLAFLLQVEGLRGTRLGCFCKPLDCHGDVYAEWLEGHDCCE